ncbi:MAG: NAD(P)-binding oxidoreductase [Actinomycetota bacterium]
MKVVVFGASGKTGTRVVQSALDRDHDVTAFGRSVGRLEPAPGLNPAKGDVFDEADVLAAVTGQDAVIVCLGSVSLKDRTTLTRGTANIVQAMSTAQVERLIVLSAAGAGSSWELIPWSSRLLFRTMLRNVIADHNAQEDVVRASDTSWTIVRAAVLSEKPGTGATEHGPDLKTTKITRDDVAAFLVDRLGNEELLRQEVNVSN